MRSELVEKRNFISRKLNSLNPFRQKGMTPKGGTKRVRNAEIGRYVRHRLGRVANHAAGGALVGSLIGQPGLGAAIGVVSGAGKPPMKHRREDRLERALKTTKRKKGGVITKKYPDGQYAVMDKQTGQVKTRQGIYENKLITRNGWKNA